MTSNGVITASTPDDDSYSWTIPAGQELDNDFKVRVSGVTHFGTWDKSDQYFTISASGPPAYDTIQNETIANGETQCFNASNTITVAGQNTTVDVNSDGEATFIAGNKIVFNPGFHSHLGSYCDAHITLTSDYCSQQQSIPSTNHDTGVASNGKSSNIYDKPDTVLNTKVYPNPTTGSFTVDFLGKETTADIIVLNFQGNEARNVKCENQNAVDIDISHLTGGMYVVVIKTSDKVITKKVVKVY